jgi:hypothetical protein
MLLCQTRGILWLRGWIGAGILEGLPGLLGIETGRRARRRSAGRVCISGDTSAGDQDGQGRDLGWQRLAISTQVGIVCGVRRDGGAR